LRVLRLALQRVIEVVHERTDQDAADLVTHVAQASAELAQARRRFWVAARLRLYRRAQVIRQARSRGRGVENDILPTPGMGE